jgi:hypothetical protein
VGAPHSCCVVGGPVSAVTAYECSVLFAVRSSAIKGSVTFENLRILGGTSDQIELAGSYGPTRCRTPVVTRTEYRACDQPGALSAIISELVGHKLFGNDSSNANPQSAVRRVVRYCKGFTI